MDFPKSQCHYWNINEAHTLRQYIKSDTPRRRRVQNKKSIEAELPGDEQNVRGDELENSRKDSPTDSPFPIEQKKITTNLEAEENWKVFTILLSI